MTYLAHIAGDGRKQTAAEHLNGTAERCALFAAPFGAEELGRLAGLSHDLGKYSMEFQRRLANGPKVDHATAGAFACWRMGQPLAAFAAAGHHGGLPDGGTQGDSPDAGTFWGRMKRAERGALPDCSPWTEEITLPSPAPPPCGTEPLSQMFFTRMLFSCLTDADFLDTETFMDGCPRPEHPAPLDDLWERLQRHISGWFPPQGALNSCRCAVLEQCIRMGKTQSPGLFTLTVPTGGGKTVASLAFALAHARARGLRRIIYVIPYTSIIEQTAQEFRTILGAENVLEHHSNAAYEIDAEATPETVRLAQAAENWDMPVVVTTAVQFFESLYANRPSQCRKLHNLAGSVILFDEAQLLPLPCLRPCIHAIAQLVQHYGASAVLCTATQPALGPLFAEFLPGRPAVELCPPELCPPESFRRVCFRQAGRLDWDTLSGQLQQHEQVLCVVNSRKSAQEIFTRLSGEGNFHLSTLMYPAHRRAKLEEIRRRLKGGLPCRVISTSLIEAGVDVDFPAVFREEAGLDSILQAAGRCNREGKRPVSESMKIPRFGVPGSATIAPIPTAQEVSASSPVRKGRWSPFTRPSRMCPAPNPAAQLWSLSTHRRSVPTARSRTSTPLPANTPPSPIRPPLITCWPTGSTSTGSGTPPSSAGPEAAATPTRPFSAELCWGRRRRTAPRISAA